VRHTPQTPQFIALQTVIAGRFSLEREIGRGGGAVVYLARDVSLNRPVAIKLLNPDVAADQTIRQRFLREARTAGLLSQPNIVPIHAVEEHGDIVFFVMGYVDGETLGRRIKRGGMLEIEEATRILREVAWALGYAHARGITHRDVKPDNIMIERDTGRAMVTDFGIARHVDDPHGGEIVGTADYMSPEQAAGHPVDARSDIYSLGATAFHAITGQPPFHATTDEQVLRLHETQPAPSVKGLRAGVPERLVEIIDRCLAKDPADRFATAEEFAVALGDVVGTMRRVPAVVDRFLQLAQNTSRRLMVLAPLGGVVAYALGALSGFGIGHVLLFFFVSWMLVLELLIPPAVLLAAARNVLVQGISYDEFREIVKVQAAEGFGTSKAFGRRVGVVSSTTTLLLGAGGLGLAIGAVVIAGLLHAMPDAWRLGLVSLGVSGIILSLGAVGWAVFSLMGASVSRSTRYGLWLGPFGRRFFRLAAIGLGRVPVAGRPSIRRPEALLSQAVRSALADLGGLAQREETLAVISELEARIGVLRAERDAADLVVDQPDVNVTPPGSTQPAPERPTDEAPISVHDTRLAINRQIEEAIAALEAIRVDLLRIRSGVGTHDDLKSGLTVARQIAALGRARPIPSAGNPA
jgi:predicted Ser/Thr protein kinase